MADYLRVMLESLRKYNPNITVKIIPFDDNLELTKKIARIYNAKIIKTETVWDEIGKNIYNDIEYRPGIPSWRYFRKLNVFNEKNEDIIFVDANIVCLSDLSKINKPNTIDFLFHNHSAMGRCFRKEDFENIMSNLSPGLKGGYNMGFFMTNSNAMDINFAKKLSQQSNLKKYFGKAPEQAFLAYYIALTNSSHSTLSKHDNNSAYNHNSNQEVETDDGISYFIKNGAGKGKQLYLMKSTGQDINSSAKNYNIIKNFLNDSKERFS